MKKSPGFNPEKSLLLNPNAVLVLDQEGRLVYLNPRALSWFPELATDTWAEHPVLEGIGKLGILESGLLTVFVREFSYRGSVYEEQIFTDRDEKGLRYIFVIDVTQYKELLKANEQARLHLDNILSSASDPILTIDYDGIIKSANKATFGLVNEQSENIIGKPLGMILTGEKPLDGEALCRLAQNGSLPSFEGELKSRDQLIPVLVSGAEMRDSSKKLLGFVIVAKDITELKKMARMKDAFIETVSHELRTPLTILSLSINNLKEGITGPLAPPQEKILLKMEQNCKTLGRLIEDLIGLSLLESGQSKIQVESFSLSTLMDEVLIPFLAMANEKKIVVEQEKTNLCDLSADKKMIARVLKNLLENAIHFARKKVTIKATNLPQASLLQASLLQAIIVSVIDDGCGISREEQKELFKKFTQLHRPQGGAGYKGCGLGLAICKKIIAHHGGKIWVESEVGHGSAFHFMIPAIFQQSPDGI